MVPVRDEVKCLGYGEGVCWHGRWLSTIVARQGGLSLMGELASYHWLADQ